MECQSCHSRKATVHLTELLGNKEKREVHLCEQCAAQQSPGVESMGGLLASAFSPASAAPAGKTTGDPATTRCTVCGLSYQDFRSRGRLGCSACYDVFREALDPLLEKIHGGTQHMGKTPLDAQTRDRPRERALVSLRRKLQAAVKDENYELAAQLRDQLRKAETGEAVVEGEGAEGADAGD